MQRRKALPHGWAGTPERGQPASHLAAAGQPERDERNYFLPMPVSVTPWTKSRCDRKKHDQYRQ
jgi:hypothetical protein